MVAELPGVVRAVYEAGPTGFGLARAARERGIEMMVCSPGAIPRQPGDRVKTDARDAVKLARLHAAGQLRAVVVPSRELEGLRDLVRCREDLRGDLMRCRHRISKLLLRRDHVWTGPGNSWTHSHLKWLSTVRFDDGLVDTVLGEHLAHHEALLARRDRLDGLLVDQAAHGDHAALIARLRCLRGIDTLTAIGLVAEIGDFAHFAHPRRLASYLGMTPSEHSSGTRRRQGAITKAGSSHARRLLVEAAWHYRRPPRISLTLRRRQDGQPPTSSTRPGAPNCDCTDAGRISTRLAANDAPPSRSPSPASSAALSGRSPDSPTETLTTTRSGGGGGRRAPTGTRDRVMSTAQSGRRARC